MQTISTLAFSPLTGRIYGSYVYCLLCDDGDKIFIKIGASHAPTQRMHHILGGCPVPPGVLAFAALPSKEIARNAENALHVVFEEWRTHREWFRFHKDEKPRFNELLRTALVRFSSRSWRLKWEKMKFSEDSKIVSLERQKKSSRTRESRLTQQGILKLPEMQRKFV